MCEDRWEFCNGGQDFKLSDPFMRSGLAMIGLGSHESTFDEEVRILFLVLLLSKRL